MVINYFFYRIHKYYSKEKNNRSPIFTASIYIAILEIFFLYFVFMMFNALFYSDRLLLKEVFLNNGIELRSIKIIAAVCYAIAQLLNYFFYKNRIKGLEERYKYYSANKWFKLWMLYAIGLFLFLFPILLFKVMQLLFY